VKIEIRGIVRGHSEWWQKDVSGIAHCGKIDGRGIIWVAK